MNTRIDECTSNAKKHYDIMAFGLKSLRDGNAKGINDLLKRGGSIRILSVDPECKALNDRDIQEKKTEGQTAYTIRQLIGWVEDLKKIYPGQIEIKLAKHLPSFYEGREMEYDKTVMTYPYFCVLFTLIHSRYQLCAYHVPPPLPEEHPRVFLFSDR